MGESYSKGGGVVAVKTAWRPPSIGFVAVVLVHLAGAAMLWWGFSTPRLDRIWTLHHELKIGKISKLKADERKLLQDAMRDHPTLGNALIARGDIGVVSANRDGWIEHPFATLVRTANAKTNAILINVETSPEHLPFSIEFESGPWEQKLDVTERKDYRVELPTATDQPEVITVEVNGKRFKADPAILGLRLHFEGEEQWQDVEEEDDGQEEAPE
jgi:hypothetical protein